MRYSLAVSILKSIWYVLFRLIVGLFAIGFSCALILGAICLGVHFHGILESGISIIILILVGLLALNGICAIGDVTLCALAAWRRRK